MPGWHQDSRQRLALAANASRHSALSHGHIVKIEEQLKREVQELLALAEQADTASVPDGLSLNPPNLSHQGQPGIDLMGG